MAAASAEHWRHQRALTALEICGDQWAWRVSVSSTRVSLSQTTGDIHPTKTSLGVFGDDDNN